MSQCPVAHGFQPFSEEYLADPYPLYAAIRDQGRVAYVPDFDLYVISHYEDVSQIFSDRDTYSSLNSTSPFMPVVPEAQKILNSGFPRRPTFTNCDPPRHPKMRNAASRCLTKRRWGLLQELVRDYTKGLIEKMETKKTCNLYDDLAFPLPAYAGFTLLGFPYEDIDLLKSWCGPRVLLTYGDLSPEDQVKAAQDLVDFWEYCRKFVEMRKETPGDDLTTDLLELSKKRGDDLTTEDIINMVYSIALAGHETTTNAMLNCINQLMKHRDTWQRLCDDPSLIPQAIEELLRLDSPTLCIRRRTTRATRIGDVDIPADALIVLLLGATHHDTEKFENPEELNIDRANADDHLAFGKDFHYCLGAPIARYELITVLELLTQKFPDMRLVEDQKIDYAANILLRAPTQMLIELQP